jgi:hypothetical protein
MSFVYPGFLWALTLLVIPVIIHLFNFKRHKTLYFSSLQFVKKVDQQTKSTQRLRHWLILLSRILAITFLVLAFAQPYLSDSETESKELTTVLPIFIDNSFSMEARGAEGQLLSQAKEKAKEVVENSDVNSLFLIGTNEMSGLEERLLNKAEAIKRIDEINPSSSSRAISEIINWQQDILTKNNINQNELDLLLFSDFQKSGVEKSPQESELNYIPVRVKPENALNISLDSLWFSAPIHRANESSELNVRIRNYSASPIENVEVEVTIGQIRKLIYLSADAKSTATSSFTYKEEQPGWVSGKVSVADEQLFFDNDLYFSYEISENVNILLIDGQDAVPNFDIVYNLDQFYRVETVKEGMVTRDDYLNKDLILLNGLNRFSSGMMDELVKLGEEGSTIGVFPGANIDKGSFNTLLSKLKLNRIDGTTNSGTRLDKLAYEDVFFRGVFDRKPAAINLPVLKKAYLTGAGQGIPLIEMKNGKPLFSYSSGKLKAFCFYSSLSEEFGQFVNDAIFSTLALRMGEISKRQRPLFLTIGSDISFPVYEALPTEDAIKLKNADFEAIPETEKLNNVQYININLMNQMIPAGNFEIYQKGQLGSLSLNYGRSESTRSYYNDEELTKLLGGKTGELAIQELSSSSNFNVKDVDKPFSYWKLCIILTLIFVLTEMAIVRFYK